MLGDGKNFLFQCVLGVAMGLFLGVYSRGLFMTILFTVFFEYYVFAYGEIMNDPCNLDERLIINLLYLFGWVLSKTLFLRESGFEPLIDDAQLVYETFTN
jgi:hypothetical protein